MIGTTKDGRSSLMTWMTNYRGISLLSITANVCHRILLNRIQDHVPSRFTSSEGLWKVFKTISPLFDLKGCRMGRSDKVSLWYVAY